MKKALLIAALALIAGAATAQQKPIRWGIKVRFSSAKLNETFSKPNYDLISTGSVKNVDIAVFAEMNIAKNAVFQPGLSYIQKGGTSINGENGYSSDKKEFYTVFTGSVIKLNYLEMPLNLLYNIPLKPCKIFVGMGPYVAIILSAKNKQSIASIDEEGDSTQNHSTQPVKLGSGSDELRRMDFGINALAGFRFNNGLEIGGGMGFGLTSLSNISTVKTHNQTKSISIGYFF